MVKNSINMEHYLEGDSSQDWSCSYGFVLLQLTITIQKEVEELEDGYQLYLKKNLP
jgi:hypothetical protein